jgi:hypothetical protein
LRAGRFRREEEGPRFVRLPAILTQPIMIAPDRGLPDHQGCHVPRHDALKQGGLERARGDRVMLREGRRRQILIRVVALRVRRL